MKGRILLLAALAAGNAMADDTVFRVNLTQDRPDANPGDGVCSYNNALDPHSYAVCTLRAAVMEANATPDQDGSRVEIQLMAGAEYALTVPGALEQAASAGDLDLLRPMRIGVVAGDTQKARIVGPEDDRIFHVLQAAADVELADLELTRGQTAGQGCAIYSEAETLTLRRVDVHHNCPAGSTRGVLETVATLRLVDSEVHGNLVTFSVLSAVGDKAALELSRSSVYSNAQKFAAVYVGAGAQLVMSHTTVSSNSDAFEASGLTVDGGTAWIEDSALMFNGGHELSLVDAPLVSIARSIVLNLPSSDTCWNRGGNKISVRWSLFHDDGCKTAPGSDVFDGGGNVFGVMPALTPLGYWGGLSRNHRPEPGSIVVDFIPQEACSTFPEDQRGLPRLVAYDGASQPRCDIGPVELEAAVDDEPADPDDPDDPIPPSSDLGPFSDGFE